MNRALLDGFVMVITFTLTMRIDRLTLKAQDAVAQAREVAASRRHAEVQAEGTR